jgi:hypothetical protein
MGLVILFTVTWILAFLVGVGVGYLVLPPREEEKQEPIIAPIWDDMGTISPAAQQVLWHEAEASDEDFWDEDLVLEEWREEDAQRRLEEDDAWRCHDDNDYAAEQAAYEEWLLHREEQG